jgi:hypothetical protein
MKQRINERKKARMKQIRGKERRSTTKRNLEITRKRKRTIKRKIREEKDSHKGT